MVFCKELHLIYFNIMEWFCYWQVRVWEIKPSVQTLQFVLKEHKGPVSSVDVSSTNKEAVTASTDGTCIIWNIE